MRISKVHIHNFRSIADMTLDVLPHLVLLGPNNHGKSNVLKAIEFALGQSKADVADFSSHLLTDNNLWVDITFTDLTEQEKTTFTKYLAGDSICIRRGAKRDNDKIEDTYYGGYCMSPTDWWLKSDKDTVKKLTLKTEYEATPLKDMLSGKPSQDAVKSAQDSFIATNREKLTFERVLEVPLMGAKSVAVGILPEFFLIPAVRDLSQESQIKSTSLLGKLLNKAITEMAERDERFKSLRTQLSELVATFNKGNTARPLQLVALEAALDTELTGWGVKVDIEINPPQIEKLFELGTDLHIDDGVRTLAEQKGHGLQRAMLFALIKAWSKSLQAPTVVEAGTTGARVASTSVIFAIEEPELFLHPHAQRQMADDLRKISETSGHQVLLCSHSAHFVDMEHYKEITIVSKPTATGSSDKRQCLLELFVGEDGASIKQRFNMAHWINPDRGEMFFARRVIFVEGATEAVVLPYLGRRLGLTWRDVSIIDTGSKFNLSLYIKIAKAFGFDYGVIHDEDPVPDPIPSDWNEDKTKSARKTFGVNAQISALCSADHVLMLSPDFEGTVGFSKSMAEKRGKPMAAICQLEAKTDVTEFTPILKTMAEFAFGVASH
jgi:putative ATP-dependent endonuclease of OLD family